jgi:hypothetical protein
MLKQAKYILICLSTATFAVISIVVLDSLTGVPFNYAVPVSLIIALLPHSFWLRANHRVAAEADESTTNQRRLSSPAKARSNANAGGRSRSRRFTSAAKVHSIIFTS